MFSRLNVRTKLLVMLLPAALGLCSLAGLGVKTRLDDRSAAQHDRDASSIAAAATTFVHEMQQERLVAANRAGTSSNGSATNAATQALEAQEAATDTASARLSTVLQATDPGSAAAAEDIATLRRGVDGLSEARAAAVQSTPAEITDSYSELIDRAMAAVGSLDPVDDGRSDAVSRRWLAEGIEAESRAAAAATGLFSGSGTRADVASETAGELSGRAAMFFDTYSEYAGSAGTDRFTDARATPESTAADDLFAQLAAGADASFSADPATWPTVVGQRLETLEQIEQDGFRADIARLSSVAEDADSAAIFFAAGAAGSCLLVILLAFGVSRHISTTLRRLTDAAREISHEQVPALVQSLKSGGTGGPAVRFTEVETGSGDEFAEVGNALNDLGRAVVTVATEQQQSLRKGISDIFVNLARRNQTLLDRQIQFIDRLEANEQDPDQLENLFRLDHLATRMRRNAESLLVLAGAEAPRRRARDVELSDVIRVAVGEVEDFARISLLAVEEANAVGAAAVDIAHLLAELMENGAQYSPPEKTVDIVGHRAVDGGYVISITDHGVGMTAERLDAANRLLASPPPVGLALSRALGFVVAGTLANRHGIRIHLVASASGGVTAEVVLPASLILAVDVAADAEVELVAPVATFEVGAFEPVPLDDSAFTGAAFTGAAFAAAAFEQAPFPATSDEYAAPPVGPEQIVLAGWNAKGEYVQVPAVEVSAVEAVAFDTTSLGAPTTEPVAFSPAAVADQLPPSLPRRTVVEWSEEHLPATPAPSQLAGMLPEGPAFEEGLYSLLDRAVPTEPEAATPPPYTGNAPDGPLPQRAPGGAAPAPTPEDRTTATNRAPEEVRSLLSRYRSGLETGRAGSGAAGNADGGRPPGAPGAPGAPTTDSANSTDEPGAMPQ